VPSGSGLALLTVGGMVQLYSINLVTGAGTLIGDFLNGITPASGLAIPLPIGPFPLPTLQLSAFGPSAGGWSSNDTYPRAVADVSGDGAADIVGFSSAGVFVSRATANPGAQFAAPTFELAAFGADAGGWSSNDTYPRALADVNGDGMADIIGFSSVGAFESLATAGGHFATSTFELAAFGTNAGGWSSQDLYPRALADVNGDGMADIVGFGATGVPDSPAARGYPQGAGGQGARVENHLSGNASSVGRPATGTPGSRKPLSRGRGGLGGDHRDAGTSGSRVPADVVGRPSGGGTQGDWPRRRPGQGRTTHQIASPDRAG